MAPGALDGDDARGRIADLKSLQILQGASGTEVRKLYASVYTSLRGAQIRPRDGRPEEADGAGPAFPASDEMEIGIAI